MKLNHNIQKLYKKFKNKLCDLSAVNHMFSNMYKYGDLKLSNTNSRVQSHHPNKNILILENIILRVVSQIKNLDRNECSFVINQKL
jgi:hypothetical protein